MCLLFALAALGLITVAHASVMSSSPVNAISKRTLPSGWTSVGCVVDSSNRVLPAEFSAPAALTTASCISYCSSGGYSLAGTEDGGQCFCANSYYGGALTFAPTTDCNVLCGGDSTETCGGPWRLSVYSGPASDLGLPTGWSPVGCLTDSNSRTLSGEYYAPADLTTESCISYCSSAGYSLAGMEDGGQCFCANSYSGGSPPFAPITDCNITCGADSRYCGAGWRLSAYSGPATGTGLPSGWSTVGCLEDSSIRTLAADSFTASNVTTQSCIEYCSSRGYSFAGTEYADWCFCDDSYNGGSPTFAPITDCSMPCAGNPAQTCGGTWRLSTYSTTESGLPPGWSSMGCLIDSSTRTLAEDFFSASDLTTHTCISYCTSNGYSLAGTELNYCFCANSYTGGSPTFAPYYDCNSPCGGDSTEYCGGTWRLNAYMWSAGY